MDEFIALNPVLVRRLIGTLIVIIATIVLSAIARRIALATFDEQERQYMASKWLSRGLWLIAIVLTIALWSPNASQLITVLTIIGAGLAVALRDVLLSFVGWIHLQLHPPYRRGDRIEVNNVRGDVVDVGLTQTTMLEVGEWVEAHQSTGRLVHVPNGWLYTHGVKNYTEGFEYLWFEQSVVVTFESDWEEAREIILEIADATVPNCEEPARRQLRQMTSEYLVQMNVLTPYVYVSLADHGVKLTLRHLTAARGRRSVRHDLISEILRRFQEHEEIHIAYPTYRISSSDSVPPAQNQRISHE
ncbi:mechanosensitive ion channel protein MscS [Longibacter salinarum]|uniref:Mechanosensitive ion channel protein MscS n=1 Tax=Longibacter salinarum TaxID=1850348 RepID=A0A2A8CVW7_9BACT|nr:mechanosensitive ion channel family protein [Longibacter salinarum]PEN12899.1 mechanosensitive ion channel protein MscS [Longibacter salinarum]